VKLRIHIAEKWEPQDYIAAFSAIERMYYVALFADRPGLFDESWNARRYPWTYTGLEQFVVQFLDVARAVADANERLIVSEIRHGSPGFIDFDGFGEVAKAIDRTVGRLIKVFTERNIRKELDAQAELDTEMKRENLNSMKIDNARKLLDLRRDHPEIGPYLPLERVLVEEQTKIENLTGRGLITGPTEHPDE